MLRIPTAVLFVVVLATSATAAEVKAFVPGALRPVMSELVPEFERASAHKVTIQYGTAGALADRIQKGESADLAILTPPQIENLAKQGVLASDSKGNVGKIGIGVAVSKGAAKPDIGSVESFKRSMLAAKSIAYIDPATGGPAGIYLARLFERLGIAADVAPKTKLTQGPAQDAVIKGESEIVLTQVTELMAEPKVDLVGPLPAAIQNFTQFTAGRLMASKEPEAAIAFIRFLASPTATSILRSKGIEPG